MRAYILTIDGQPRNSGLIASCEAAGIAAEVVIGVRGSALTPDELREQYDERASVFTLDRPMGRGEIGCALGHRQIVERFLAEQDDDWAVVLEDDAEVGQHLRAARDLARVGDAIGVAVGKPLAGIADAVRVAVRLSGVRHRGAVVAAVEDTVPVRVRHARIHRDHELEHALAEGSVRAAHARAELPVDLPAGGKVGHVEMPDEHAELASTRRGAVTAASSTGR